MASILVPLACVPGAYAATNFLVRNLPSKISIEKRILAALVGTVALAILLAPAKVYASFALLAGYTIFSGFTSCVGIYLYLKHARAIVDRGASSPSGFDVIDATKWKPNR